MEKVRLDAEATKKKHRSQLHEKEDKIKWLEHRMELMQRYIDGLDQELNSPARSEKEEKILKKTLWSWEEAEKAERKGNGRRFKLPRVSLESKKKEMSSSSSSSSSSGGDGSSSGSDEEFEFQG